MKTKLHPSLLTGELIKRGDLFFTLKGEMYDVAVYEWDSNEGVEGNIRLAIAEAELIGLRIEVIHISIDKWSDLSKFAEKLGTLTMDYVREIVGVRRGIQITIPEYLEKKVKTKDKF